MSILLQYLAWRVLTGLHRTVRMSFMLVEVCTRLVLRPVQAEVPTHLRQLPRRRRGRRQYISRCECGTAGRDAEWGTCGAWASYLGVHIPHLKQYHHFIFSATHPGVVMLEYSNSSEETFTMLDSGSWSPVASELPPLLKPSGLPLERQWYLHRQIRPYCREGLTCPKPSLSLDTTTNTTTKKEGAVIEPLHRRQEEEVWGNWPHPQVLQGRLTLIPLQ